MWRAAIVRLTHLPWFRRLATQTPPGRAVADRFVAGETLAEGMAIARVLRDEGYIGGYVASDGPKPTLTIDLKYHKGQPVIEVLDRVSRPGLRIYKGRHEIPSVMNGLGVAIVTTPKGVMTDRKARQAGIGGEVLCYVS